MTTLNLTVAASADDSRYYQTGPDWSNTSANIAFGTQFRPDEYNAQNRFTNVTIPKNASILSCLFTVRDNNDANTGAPCNIILGFEAADNPGQVTSQSDFTTREGSLTSTTVSHTVSPFTLNSDYTFPDLAASLQEIVTRSGWASGNAVNLFDKNNGSGTNPGDYAPRFGQSYDTDTTNCGRLAINYLAGTQVAWRLTTPQYQQLLAT